MIVKGLIGLNDGLNDQYFAVVDGVEYAAKVDTFDLEHLIKLTKNTGERINDKNLVKVNLMVLSPKEFKVMFPMDKKDLQEFWNNLTIKE